MLSFIIVVLAQAAFGLKGLAQTPAPSCPAVRVESEIKNREPWWRADGLCPGAQVIFSAFTSGIGPDDRPQYNWTVSAGVIVSGQGTPTIIVSTKGSDDTVSIERADELAVTATVEVTKVSGLSAECVPKASATVGIATCCLTPCPTISIQCPTEFVDPGVPLTVSVNLSGGDPELEITYNWQVSAGEIVAGQGTPTITVDTTGLAGQHPTATVEIGGLPPECDRQESCTPPIAKCSPPGHLRGETGGTSEEGGKARLDGLAFQPGREPGGGKRRRVWDRRSASARHLETKIRRRAARFAARLGG